MNDCSIEIHVDMKNQKQIVKNGLHAGIEANNADVRRLVQVLTRKPGQLPTELHHKMSTQGL